MTHFLRLSAFATLFFLLVDVSVAQRLEAHRDGFLVVRTETHRVPAGGILIVDRISGDVHIEAWNRPALELTEEIFIKAPTRNEARDVAEDMFSTVRVGSDEISIRGSGERYRWNRSEHNRALIIRAPASLELDVETSGGSIAVFGFDRRVELQTSGGSIEARRIGGKISVASAGGSLELEDIDADVQARTAGGEIDIRRVNGTVHVVTAGGDMDISDVENDIVARTAGGSITIVSVGGRIDASSAGGTIEISAVSGKTHISTNGGDIELLDLDDDVEASTGGGDIEGRGIRGAVTVRTAAGDIDLEEIEGSVDAVTDVGDLDLEMIGALTGEIRLRASHGDISLKLPASIRADLVVEASSGGRSGRNLIESDFSLNFERRSQGSGRQSATGSINGGGHTIDIRTSGGEIEIVKAKSKR